MERPTSKRLTDVSRHSIDTLRFVPHLTAASSDMTDLFKASGRGSHAIRHALTPILLKLGHCAALQDLNQCFLTNSINCFFFCCCCCFFFRPHGGYAKCRWGYNSNIFHKKMLFNHGNLDLSLLHWTTVYFEAWVSRISHSIHYHPRFVSSSCTEQNRGSVLGKTAEIQEWMAGVVFWLSNHPGIFTINLVCK